MNWKIFYQPVLDSLKEELKELWKEGKENLPWLEDIAMRTAKHAFMSKFGPEAQRAEHKEAIQSLKTAVEVRFRSESIRVKSEKQEVFRTVIMAVINTGVKFISGLDLSALVR